LYQKNRASRCRLKIVPEEQSFKVQTEECVSEQPYKKYFKIYVTKVAKN
jgi:hypothetical protein